MPSIPYGLSSYERAEGDFTELPVVNMYGEETPVEDKGVALQSRPGLGDREADMGSGPVKALFQQDGVISGALLGVSGGALYEETTSKGTVSGSGPVSIAGNETGVMITAGATLYHYDGTTFSTVAFPDSANVVKVSVGASRFIMLREGTGQFYWTDALEYDVEALDFATAESQSDRALDALFIDDMSVIFGSTTIEFWPNTGDSSLPFRPLESRVIERGIKATGCATAFGPTFAWVTNWNEVCVQDETNIISNVGLQARIAASSEVRLFTFFIDGVEFLALHLDNETQVYNRRSRLWSEFATYGLSNWDAQCHAAGVFGSATTGKTLEWSGRTDVTATETILERRFRAGFVIDGGAMIIKNLSLRTNPGNTSYLSGDYADPVVEMRLSRDAGKTWSDWEGVSLGEQGEYREHVQWRALGQASRPGFLSEFRVTDPVDFRVSDVRINEPWGGR